MTLALAVVALDNMDGRRLVLLLGAESGRMTQLIAIVALGDATINNLTSIRKTRQVILGGLGPHITLARASRLGAETVGHRILLVHVALKVHVGQGGGKIRLLDRNEPELNVLLAKGLLKLEVGGIRAGLDVHLHGVLDII
jgi:hypothetical protein